MIKSNELRVGNIVENRGVEYVADFITIQMAHNYNPITLTPEILEKVDWNGYVKFHINSYFSIDDVGHFYYRNDYTGINVNHVHQLQNLYFALTGNELTINLK